MADMLRDAEIDTGTDSQSGEWDLPEPPVELCSDADRDRFVSILFHCLSHDAVPGLREDATLCVALHEVEGGWKADVNENVIEISESEESIDSAEEAMIDTLLSLRDTYVNETDERLTDGALELRDWLRSKFM